MKLRSVLATISLLTLALAGTRCVDLPSSPIFPTWEMQGSIPLLDRVFTVADFRMKDTSLSVAGDGGLIYASTQKFDPTGIDTIFVEPVPVTRQQTLGFFAVDVPPIRAPLFTYDDFNLPLPPDTIFPPASFTIPARNFTPAPSFDYVEFQTGTIVLTIRNSLPFPLQLPDPLIIRNNTTDTSVVASFTFPDAIPADAGVRSAGASLAGKTVRSALRLLAAAAATPGGTGTIDANEGLQLEITITGASVRASKSTIPAQSVPPQQRSFVLDDSVTLVSALFRKGTMTVEIQNGVDVDVDVSIRFVEMSLKSSGAPYVLTHHFAGVGTHSQPVDMSALRFGPAADGTGTVANFDVELTLTGNSEQKEIRSTDEVQVSIFSTSPIVVEQVMGRIPPTTMAVATGASGLTLGEIAQKFEGNVTFDSIQIAIQLHSSSGFPADYTVYFVGRDRRSVPPKTDSLYVPPPVGSSQRRIFPALGTGTSIVLDNTVGLNTFLAKFFPHFPDTFMIRGTMTMNPADIYAAPEGKQTVYDTSKVYSSVDVHFPVRIGVTNATVRDTIPLRVREKFPHEMAKSTRTATMFFSIENGMPFSLVFQSALLGPGPGGPRDTLLMIPTNGPRTIQAGTIGSNGVVVAPSVNNFSIVLTGPEAEAFGNGESLSARFDVQTPNGGTVVKVRDTDAVRLRASGNLVYQVNKP